MNVVISLADCLVSILFRGFADALDVVARDSPPARTSSISVGGEGISFEDDTIKNQNGFTQERTKVLQCIYTFQVYNEQEERNIVQPELLLQ